MIPNANQTAVLLIEFKNSRISDLKDLPSIWEEQVKKSEEFLCYNEEKLLVLPLKITPYNKFKNIKERFDDACQELRKNAGKLKKKKFFRDCWICNVLSQPSPSGY